MDDWLFWTLVACLAGFWFFFNRNSIRSKHAEDRYRDAVVDFNKWLGLHPNICPCQFWSGRKLKAELTNAYAIYMKVSALAIGQEYLDYLKNFHAIGCAYINHQIEP